MMARMIGMAPEYSHYNERQGWIGMAPEYSHYNERQGWSGTW